MSLLEALLDLFFRVVMLFGLLALAVWCWSLCRRIKELDEDLTGITHSVNDHDEDLRDVRQVLAYRFPPPGSKELG